MSSTSSSDIAEDFYEPKLEDASNPEMNYCIAQETYYSNSNYPAAVSKEHGN